MRKWNELVIAALGCLTVACGGESNEPQVTKLPDAPTNHHAGGHVHHAPRGGLLVVLAQETAHAELLLDANRGRLNLYLLGAHAVTPLRSAQAEIAVDLETSAGPLSLALTAQGNALSGDKLGDTSQFAVTDPRLVGLQGLKGKLGRIQVLGRSYVGVPFDSTH